MADPSLVAGQYRRAIAGYLADLQTVMQEAAVDYHRVSLDDPVEDVLARFLIGRKPKQRGSSSAQGWPGRGARTGGCRRAPAS